MSSLVVLKVSARVTVDTSPGTNVVGMENAVVQITVKTNRYLKFIVGPHDEGIAGP